MKKEWMHLRVRKDTHEWLRNIQFWYSEKYKKNITANEIVRLGLITIKKVLDRR